MARADPCSRRPGSAPRAAVVQCLRVTDQHWEKNWERVSYLTFSASSFKPTDYPQAEDDPETDVGRGK